jgi:hypothetical protein
MEYLDNESQVPQEYQPCVTVQLQIDGMHLANVQMDWESQEKTIALDIDGERLALLLMPHIANVIRGAMGYRG